MKKQFLIFSAFVLFFGIVNAQIPQVTWQKCYQPLYNYSYLAMAEADNGYMILSQSGLTADTLCDTAGSYNVLSKIDTIGNVQWQKCFGGCDHIQLHFIKPLPDGSFVLVGESEGYGGDIQSEFYGYVDFSLLRVSATGDLLWEKRFGSSAPDYPRNLEVLSDGSILVSGYCYGSGGLVSANYGYADTWVFRCDSEGNLLWEKSLGDSTSNRNSQILETADHHLLIASERFKNGGNLLCDTSVFHKFWIGEFDLEGNLLQSSCFEEYHTAWMRDMIEMNDGFIIVGEGYASDNNLAYNDLWFAKLDKDLVFQWQKTVGGEYSESISEIIRENDSTLLLLASTSSTNFATCNHSWSSDIWFLMMDNECNIKDQSCFGGQGSEYGTTIRLGDYHYITIASTNYPNSGDVDCDAAVSSQETYWLFESKDCSLYRPHIPTVPIGPAIVCTLLTPQSTYTVPTAMLAQSYEWSVFPIEAGTFTLQDTTITITWAAGFEGTVSVIARSLNYCGMSDWSQAFYADVHTCTGITDQNGWGIAVWPNPANESINFKFNGNLPATSNSIEVYDLFGRKIAVLPVASNQARWDCSTVSVGMYIYKTNVNNQQFTGRITINR